MMMAHGLRSSLRCRESTYRVRQVGDASNTDELERLIELVAELTRVGVRELDPLLQQGAASLAYGPVEWGLPSHPRLLVDTPQGQAVGEVRWATAGPQLSLRLERGVGHSFAAAILDGQAHEVPGGLLSESATAQLPLLGGSTLRGDADSLTLVFQDVPSPARFQAGATLLTEVGRGHSSGAFR
jgi:hypothetical protein